MKKLIAILMLLILAVPAMAADFDLVLQWDENTEPDLATGENPRYKIYMKEGASLNGIKSDAQAVPQLVADDENADPVLVQRTLPDLDDTKQYFIAVTALDNWGNESDLSDEVSTDTTAPAVPGGCRIISIINNGGTVNIK